MSRFSYSRLRLFTLAICALPTGLVACSSEPSTGSGAAGSSAAGLPGAAGQGSGPGGSNAVGGAATGGSDAAGSPGAVPGGGTSGGAESSTAGGSSGGGVVPGAAGAAGAPGTAVMKDCATKTVPRMPIITNFETHDGVKPAHGAGAWNFSVGTTVYLGFYELSEIPSDGGMLSPYTLAFGPGADASMWAIVAKNTATTDWGGGMGIWSSGCLDASSFSGLRFSLRGSAPTGLINVFLSTEATSPPNPLDPAGGGTCDPPPPSGMCTAPSALVPISAEWTTVTIPWSMFTPGIGAAGASVTPTGDNVTGLSFQAGIAYSDVEPYPALPGAYEIAIDNLGFAPAATP